MSHFNYEICELRRRPIGSRCIEFIIRPNFLTSNSRKITGAWSADFPIRKTYLKQPDHQALSFGQ
ncbi:hypothetical protein [Leptospira noguchii]|uniref:hypothetical protein n=1 Tax=Leptospira noguchii TaxID=28182 RepID=UPI001E312ED1|nr:hypothetical protein [Leptospira noguchii]